jgi:pimeloyl-ACP methyl ester carboxylesterase
MKKPNLILINGFASNKHIIKGFVEYLSEFFKVYAFDLPGFRKDLPALAKISIKNYANYMDDKISNLQLDNYILGGISLGFLVANNTKAAKNARAIIAIEPYLDCEKLRMDKKQIGITRVLVKTIGKLNAHHLAWESQFFSELMQKEGYPKNIVNNILKHNDPKTFFETMGLLLTNDRRTRFHNKPYILIINKNDELVNAEECIDEFEKKAKKLMIIYVAAPHVPPSPKKSHFKNHISTSEMKRINRFIDHN